MNEDTQNSVILTSEEIAKKRKTIKNILVVLIGNLFAILSGTLIGFLLPKIMVKVDFANYRTFVLYASYLGVLHFGICDGVYLKYAGTDYNNLEKMKFGAFTKLLLIVESTLALITVLIGVIFLSGFYKFMLIFLGIDIIAINVSTYFELLSQATERFKLVSLRNIVRSTLLIISVSTLVLLFYLTGTSPNYELVIIIIVSINLLLSLWYIFTYRDITFGSFDKISKHKTELKEIYRTGFVLLISNYITQIIFIVDQQFVNILFDEIDFANYSFAYSLVQLIMVAISAISIVIFPTLNVTSDENVKDNYPKINAYLLIFMSVAIFIYYPLHFFINAFLNSYVDSLQFFRIILPGILISASITVIKANIYKKLKCIPVFLLFACLILLFAIGINFIAYYMFKTMLSISIATIITNILWYFVTELFLVLKYKVKWKKNTLFLIVVVATYYAMYFIPNMGLSGIMYLLIIALLSILFYKKELIEAMAILKKRKDNIEI